MIDTELFVDEPEIAGPPPIILDRSTLEHWAECPHQAHLIDNGYVSNGSLDADMGNEVHAILAEACRARHLESASASELRDLIELAAGQSRPDVQPAVVAALRRCYPLVSLLCYHHTGTDRSPDDLMRYDGGKGEYAGQLAGDLIPAAEDGSAGAVRLTAELDLLMASSREIREEVEVVDWKSGWANWTATDVKDSFQFQFYAWLIFRNYPVVNRARVRVWMTREGGATSPVEFVRDRDLRAITQRLETAAKLYLQHRGAADPGEVPAWPAPDRCSLCPAVTRCRLAHEPEADLARNPEAYLQQYLVHERAADRMKGLLSAAVRKTGKDFVFKNAAFGVNKPKESAPRAPVCHAYMPPPE